MRATRTTSRRLIVGVTAGATMLAITAVAQSASASPAHPLTGTAPKWLSQARAQGAVATSSQVNFGLLLKMRNQPGAEAVLQEISTPGSANYGKWLTNKQFNAKYAPAASDVAAVKSWLTSEGFKVTKTLPSGMYVEASGTAAQVNKTFSTTLTTYSYKGLLVQANATELSLPASTPAAVTAAVGGLIGLDQGTTLKKPASREPGPPPGSRYGVPPCSTYFGQLLATDKPTAYGKIQPYAICGYTPAQYQSAYGESSLIAKGYDGTGVTVAITDAFAAPTIVKDAQIYSKVHGQPLFKPGQFSQIIPGPKGFHNVTLCGGNGWYGEETLDVEAVHAMAPGAKIVYVGGSDCLSGLDTAWAETIDNHVADIITNSWNDGTDDINLLGTDYVNFYAQFSIEAALTGITVQFSSGDAGDDTAGGTNLGAKTVEFPADVPWVTGVGGSSVEIGSTGQWLGEYGWQNSYSTLTGGKWDPKVPGNYSSGGGGGTSVLFKQPFYQKGVVPAKDSKYFGKTAARTVPDIAMPGDPNTGMIVGETQVFPDGTYWAQYRIGGTSLASPLLAGVVAVADQVNGRPLGFINPLYYKLVGTPAVHDIVAPTIPQAQVRTNFTNGVNSGGGRTFLLQTIDVQSTTIHSTPGYDTETGVGTPNGPWFDLALRLLAHGG